MILGGWGSIRSHRELAVSSDSRAEEPFRSTRTEARGGFCFLVILTAFLPVVFPSYVRRMDPQGTLPRQPAKRGRLVEEKAFVGGRALFFARPDPGRPPGE
jgi:hypothetical protein